MGKKTGIFKGKGLSLGAKPPPADSLDSSASDENVDAQSRLSYKPSDGCCLVAALSCGLEVPLMWRTHKSILAPSIQTERLDWNLQDLCDSVLLPWPMW